MTASRIEDLANVEVEHLLGLTTGLPLVKLRAESEGTVLVGQLAPAVARSIAQHLFEAAARAEYEHDFFTYAKNAGLDEPAIGQMLMMVRQSEIRRHTGGDQ